MSGSGRPSRIFEAEETIHAPAAIGLPDKKRDVSAELRRVIRCDAARRDGQTQVHVAQGRPIAPYHRGQRGRTPNAIERRPLEHRAVGVQHAIRLRVTASVRLNKSPVQRIDAGSRLVRGCLGRLRTGDAEETKP